jgi:hypothetical protein
VSKVPADPADYISDGTQQVGAMQPSVMFKIDEAMVHERQIDENFLHHHENSALPVNGTSIFGWFYQNNNLLSIKMVV